MDTPAESGPHHEHPTDQPRHAQHRVQAQRSRAAILLAAFVAPLALLAVAAMILTWPSGVGHISREAGLIDAGVQYESATVTGAKDQSCEPTIEDRLPNGTDPESVPCLKVTAKVTSGPEAGKRIDVIATAETPGGEIRPGTRIIVQHYPATSDTAEVWAWSDFARGVPVGLMVLAFVLVTAAVARWRGLRAILGLGIAFILLWIYVIPALITGENALIVALSASVVIMTVVLYLAHGFSLRSTTALVGTLAGLLLIAALGTLGASFVHLVAVSSEEDYQLARILGDNGATILRGVFQCGVILAGLGVLNDVTITQASAVWELRAANPRSTWPQLFSGGMRIGRDHIASTIYTIAFAYVGASLPILMTLQLYQLPLGQTLTGGAFVEEIVRTLAGSIGLVLAIPFTTAIAASVALRGSQHDLSVVAADGHGHGHGHAHA